MFLRFFLHLPGELGAGGPELVAEASRLGGVTFRRV